MTGGDAGIGLAAGRALLARGATVVLAGPDAEQASLQADAGSCEANVDLLEADVRDVSSVAGLIQATVDRHGSPDLLVNAAGAQTGRQGAPGSWTAAQAASVLDERIGGVARVTHAALPHLLEGDPGTVINVAAGLAPGSPANAGTIHTASRGGVVALTNLLSAAYDPSTLTVYGVVPRLEDGSSPGQRTGPGTDWDRQRGVEEESEGERGLAEAGEAIARLATGHAPSAPGETLLVDAAGRTEPLDR